MMSDDVAKCDLCGEPMPPGEQMFKFHGYSGPCPGPPLPPQPTPLQKLVATWRMRAAELQNEEMFGQAEVWEQCADELERRI